MSSQDPQSSSPGPVAPAKAKAFDRRLAIWAILLAGIGIAAFAVPEVLKQMYLAEEEAKRKKPPTIGFDSAAAPPGVSTIPNAGSPGANSQDQEDEVKAPSGENPTGGSDSGESKDGESKDAGK